MTRPPTINDVASAAGVSRQTVSNALNSPAVVRPATLERVQAEITRLGYRPHASARRLRTRRPATIAVRIDGAPAGATGSLLDRFLHDLTAQADHQGLRVVLYTASDPDDEVKAIRRLVDGSDVDYFVLTSTFHGDPRTAWLIGQGARFVTFGRPWGGPEDDPRYLWVDVDGCHGTRAATEHLLAGAKRRVAFLGWPVGSDTGDDRRSGWRQAMLAAGWTAEQTDDLTVGSEDDLQSGQAAARDLLGRDLDGVVAASDTLALAALMAADWRLPVVGFDNGPVAASLGFSSVDQHLDQVAGQVLALLRPGGTGPTHRIVTPELVVRTAEWAR